MAIPSLTSSQLERFKNLLKGPAAPAVEGFARNYNQPFGIRAVWVRNDGGAAGSLTTTCTLTYSIYHPGTSTAMATALAPLRPRITNVEYNIPANDTYGMAFKDGTGWKLVEAILEYPKSEPCE